MEQNLILDINRMSKKLLINDIFYGLFLTTIEKKESKDVPLAAVGLNKNSMESKRCSLNYYDFYEIDMIFIESAMFLFLLRNLLDFNIIYNIV